MNRRKEKSAGGGELQPKGQKPQDSDRDERGVILEPGDGPRFYSRDKIMALFDIKKDVYYRIRSKGLLKWSRLYPGGPVVHTQQQLDEYNDYLNSVSRAGKEKIGESDSQDGSRRVGNRPR